MMGLLVALVLYLVGQKQQVSAIENGAINGFNIDGAYRDVESDYINLSFHKDENHRWQINSIENTTEGTFRETGDPNIFVLVDRLGNEYGSIHIAYISPNETSGVLYLTTATKVIRFNKTLNVPAFVEH